VRAKFARGFRGPKSGGPESKCKTTATVRAFKNGAKLVVENRAESELKEEPGVARVESYLDADSGLFFLGLRTSKVRALTYGLSETRRGRCAPFVFCSGAGVVVRCCCCAGAVVAGVAFVVCAGRSLVLAVF
jgi:hypothetical protein